MEIEIDFTKSAQENANEYYSKAKKLAIKKAGAEKAVRELGQRLEKAMKAQQGEKKEKKIVKLQKKEWYEKFHWFFTSNGLLAIGGRDATQNELINAKHFTEKDLFFHANVFGASVVVLQDGADAGKEIREEAAQFAACYSSAWKDGLNSADVYAMNRNQVSKATNKGSLGKGSFLLSGERDWYTNMSLNLAMFVKSEKLNVVPFATLVKIKGSMVKYVAVKIGRDKKSDAAKKIAKLLGFDDLDTIMQQLPTGSFKVEDGK